MRTWQELAQTFMSSLTTKTDDELIEILSEKVLCWNGDEEEPMPIEDIAFHGDATFIDDDEGCRRRFGLQVLALLAATNKPKTFELVKNHFLAGKSINGFDGTIKFLNPDNPCFEDKEEELAVRNNPKYLFTYKEDEFGGPPIEELYVFQSATISSSDFDEHCSINISDVGFDLLRESMKVVDESVIFTLPRGLFKELLCSQYVVNHATDLTKDEFGELPPDISDIILTIRLGSIEI